MLKHDTSLTHLSLGGNYQLEHSTIDCIASKCRSLVYLHIEGECCHGAETHATVVFNVFNLNHVRFAMADGSSLRTPVISTDSRVR